MLDLDTRIAILRLHREGHGTRRICRALGISRNAAKGVIRSGEAEVPAMERASKLDDEVDLIRDLYGECKGNLVRVAEELKNRRALEVAYSTLTGFCRRHGIGQEPKKPAGRYHFQPAEEMQHDTSPHTVKVAGRSYVMQCASLVLCYSRLLFCRVYLRFSRFECRGFLTEAIQYIGGSAERCMIDNSSVIIAHGTGKDAVPAAEMSALADRFDFHFEAHEVGDANRSARVERPFHYIENNFYPGRKFESFEDLDAQMLEWCDRVNERNKKHLGASPRQLFAVEQSLLKPLPIHIPEIYDLHQRRVDVEGYVALHTNRYSVPVQLIGRRVQVRESMSSVRIFDGHSLIAEHKKRQAGQRSRAMLDAHKSQPRKKKKPKPIVEEKVLRAQHDTLGRLIDRLKKRHGGRATRALRRLYRIFVDYPTQAVVKAIEVALEHDLVDLERIEQMVLKNVAGDFFRLTETPGEHNEEK